MSILDSIIKTTHKAPRITLYGDQGRGKSTLASKFPTPLFLRTEENAIIDADSLPIITNYLQIYGYVMDLLSVPDLKYKTIVIDSVTALDDLVKNYVFEKSPKVGKEKRQAETLAEAWGGYGSGFEKAASVHRALKMKLNEFQNKGIGVVFICHSETKKYKSPESDDYDIVTIAMNHDKSRQVYLNDVDAILYCRAKSHLIENDSKRKIIKTSKDFVMSSAVNEAFVCKSRYNIPGEIPLSFDELKKYIPFYDKD